MDHITLSAMPLYWATFSEKRAFVFCTRSEVKYEGYQSDEELSKQTSMASSEIRAASRFPILHARGNERSGRKKEENDFLSEIISLDGNLDHPRFKVLDLNEERGRSQAFAEFLRVLSSICPYQVANIFFSFMAESV